MQKIANPFEVHLNENQLGEIARAIRNGDTSGRWAPARELDARTFILADGMSVTVERSADGRLLVMAWMTASVDEWLNAPNDVACLARQLTHDTVLVPFDVTDAVGAYLLSIAC